MRNIFGTMKVRGGVKVEHNKFTNDCETVKMPVPSSVLIPLQQHIGAPCDSLVAKGDYVTVGQKIGDSKAFVSAPVHSSVSGVVKDIKTVFQNNGVAVNSIEIQSDSNQEVYDGIKPADDLNGNKLVDAVRESGIVGLGGAGFPTSVKLTPPAGKIIDTIIINGAECEPYITSDYREMLENPKYIFEGAKLLMQLFKVDNCIIAIENNKPAAIEKMTGLSSEYNGIKVLSIKTMYPQGAEKQLITTITGRKVPSGGLPADVGVLVHNVNTVSFIAKYVETGMPLISRRVTVAGGAVKNSMNVEVPIGTSLKDLFDFCGGFVEQPYKILIGGPMMGIAQHSLESVVTKTTNAVLALTQKQCCISDEYNCIRCGKCVDACPMNLMPLNINILSVKGRYEETLDYNVNDCIECGCCSYVCPAKRHLVQSIKLAKAEVKKLSNKQK